MDTFLKIFGKAWVQILLLIAAVGGIPGIIALYDRYNAPPAVVAVPAPMPPPKTTGSVPAKKKTVPKLPVAPNFFSDPLGWLRWNEARNEALCAVEEPPHWCPRP